MYVSGVDEDWAHLTHELDCEFQLGALVKQVWSAGYTVL